MSADRLALLVTLGALLVFALAFLVAYLFAAPGLAHQLQSALP